MIDGVVRVLLIEDKAGDAALLQLAIRKSKGNYELYLATCLAQGIELAKKHDVRVIITDLGLPDSIGLQSVERLSSECQHAAIIVLSGQENEQLYVDAISKGAESFLCKSDLTPIIVHRCIQQSIQRLLQYEEIQRLVHAVQEQKFVLEKQSAELSAKNERLEILHDASQEFVNNVSHDFRAPLGVVKQYASLIADGAVGTVTEEQCRMLRVIEDRVDDLNNMVDDMLDISRHESGLLAANRETCDSSEIVYQILSGLQQRASLRGVRIGFQPDAKQTPIFCDAEKVSRTLINLIVNAIKFSRSGDTIIVSASSSEREREVTFSVRDFGPGIEPNQCQQIFDRFRQADTHLPNSTKGFGLGLNIAKELVDLNLGQMSVASTVGKGSTFSFTVPFDEPQTVAQRFFARLKTTDSDASVNITHIAAKIEPGTPEVTQEVHLLLNCLLHSHDLLIKTDHSNWLVIQHAKTVSSPRFLERATKEIESVNRNRPQGPYPDMYMEEKGTFAIDAGLESLMEMSL